MKVRGIPIVAILAGVMTAILSGCCGIRRLSGDEFLKRAEVITQINWLSGVSMSEYRDGARILNGGMFSESAMVVL